MGSTHFASSLAHQIWDTKYRWRGESVTDTWRRVAHALAAAEPHDRSVWEERFYGALAGFRFLPGGRIQAGAGTERRVTLFNCFVMGAIEDSIGGIFEALKEGAITMQQGGGVGYDFSTLRPFGAPAEDTGGTASGPVSFMHIWDSLCATILATGARRGAMMATLACDHPDVERFINVKREAGQLRHFNLSVLVSDEFMGAVAAGSEWRLVFPLKPGRPADGDVVYRRQPGNDALQAYRVCGSVSARDLWQKIIRANYDYAEPGVIFIDRVQRANNLRYCERISATNPCGEIPLPHYGACDLGSLNLTRFVLSPFGPEARIDWAALREAAALAVRMLDNVYEVSGFPLPRQRDVARRSRRIGLGITGLADALIMLGQVYGSPASLKTAERVMEEICHSAYRASIDLARKKGAFPAFKAQDYLQSEFVARLPADIRDGIARHGIRNSHLTAIAPAGTISMLAGNVSSGLEPAFAAAYMRRVRIAGALPQSVQVTDYAVALYRKTTPGPNGLPPAFVAIEGVEPAAQLSMQAALQVNVDNAISKTVSVPREYDFARFRSLFETAYGLGLKGCTTFRPNAVTGVVLGEDDAAEVDRCCLVRCGAAAATGKA